MSIQLEQEILAAILKDEGNMDLAIENIPTADYFTVPKHRDIYRTMLGMYERSRPIDLVTLSEELANTNLLEGVGGRVYLASLLESCATTAMLPDYIERLCENNRVSRIERGCERIISAVREHESAQQLNGRLESILCDIPENRADTVRPVGQIAQEYLATVLTPKSGHERDSYYETRIPELNKMITGIFKQDMTIISGPPSMGKSSLALDIAIYNSLYGKHTLYFAIDERADAIAQRLLTAATGFQHRRFFARDFIEREHEMLTAAAIEMANRDCLFVVDRTDLTVMDIRSIARRFKRKHGLDGIVVDYIQQLRPHKKAERRDLEVAEQSRMLKAIGKELDVAVMAVSQLNREYDSLPLNPDKQQYGFPKPSQLRDSGALEQDANMILFVWNILEAMRKRGMSERDPMYVREKDMFRLGIERAFVVVGKNKIGPTGQVECRWNASRMMFYSEFVPQDDELGEPDPESMELPF